MHSYNKKTYQIVNQRLVVKALEELYYEEILKFEKENGNDFSLKLKKNTYQFKAKPGIWDNIHIKGETLKKLDSEGVEHEIRADRFFHEIQYLCEMSDSTLSQFIEELNQTLYSDMIQYEKYKNLNMHELIDKDYVYIDQLLPGHPKILLNKGRIGFNIDDIEAFAPESLNSFKLRWIGVHKSIVISDNFNDYYKYVSKFINLSEIDADLNDYFLIPVHPWQWAKYIKVQFQREIYDDLIIDFGVRGQKMTPQVSIRTLSHPEIPYDIKLPLSILNTSCVRGIPSKYIESSSLISEGLENIIIGDSFLNKKMAILKECAAIKVKKDTFEELEEGLYRYKEMLGVVFRESVSGKLSDEEKAVPTAALFFKNYKESFLVELLKRYNISINDWVKAYANNVIIPLLHLQTVHGLGLVSHGQNIIAVLKNGMPVRVLIKDFHGDLRISEQSIHRDKSEFNVLTRLKPEHLIHDLYTGHFITVLRYVSKVLREIFQITESNFYKLIAKEIHAYQQSYGILDKSVDLLRPEFEKVLVNKVRFIHGYDESHTRLTPLLGKNIKNPLCFQNEKEVDEYESI